MRCPTLKDLPPPPPGKTGWPWTEESPQLPDTMPDGRPWPRISIVTPSYNQGRFIEATIRSVLLQGYPNLEYIIIDGGSTDNSVETIKKYEPWLAYWVSQPDRGQSHAINKGWQRATGELFAWLNSDDIYEWNALAHVAREFRIHPGIDVLIGACAFMAEDGTRLSHVKRVSHFNLSEIIYRWRALPQPSAFWRTELAQRVGMIDETLFLTMDWEYFLRLWFHRVKFHFSPNCVLAVERWHSNQKSRSWDQLHQEKAVIVDQYFREYMGGRFLNLVKMIWYCRNHTRKRLGLLHTLSGFPNAQESAYLRHVMTRSI